MSRIKDHMIELQQQKTDEKTAKKLGLTFEEFDEYIEYEGTDQSDDGLVYGFYFHFSDEMPEEVKRKIVGLENNSVYVDPYFYDDEESYYGDQYDAIQSADSDFHSYLVEFENLRQLNKLETDSAELNPILKRQIYVAAIGLMEAFLSTTFISALLADEALFKKYVETTPAFKKRQFVLSNVFDTMNNLKEIAKQQMLDVIYHNLPVVREMYKNTFEIEFPPIGELTKCVGIRHHMAHRNGKTKEGALLSVDANAVTDVIDKASKFCELIHSKLNPSRFD